MDGFVGLAPARPGRARHRGIGYGGGNNIAASVVVELDTFQHGYDPNNSHVGSDR